MFTVSNQATQMKVLLFISIIMVSFFPIVTVIILLFISLLISNKYSLHVSIFCAIFLIFSLHLAFDDNGHPVGDISRYYDYYEIGKNMDFIHSYQRFKLYQAGFFSLIRDYALNLNLYGAVSVSLLVTNVFLSSIGIIRKVYDVDFNQRFKFVLAFSILSTVPFSVFYSFENALAVSMLYAAICFIVYDRRYIAYFFIFISIIIHNASIPIAGLILFTTLFSNGKYDKLFIMMPGVVFLILAFGPSFTFGVPILDRAIVSLKAYTNSGFDIISITFGTFVLLVNVLVYLKFKAIRGGVDGNRIYLRVLFFLLCFSFPMLFNSTFTYRFIWFPAMFFIPATCVILLKSKINFLSVTIIILKLIILLSLPNLLSLSAQKYVTYSDGDFLILSFFDLIGLLTNGR
ncbi:hypothetical protein LRP50_23220 [Enterovibrio sp. ZSDZ42]|uniref:EpsG family protein n=1 Tax=Enterovibrio gelatinilyticus TaxID=2899819 RepID=A0ABT5R755_9GAMM|nr:hypothetical protein [Enterovibrio sp. ZSDZ42]MDD1796035.1 hypothetical protein [Enterovibrio sp. ZSDZ42]